MFAVDLENKLKKLLPKAMAALKSNPHPTMTDSVVAIAGTSEFSPDEIVDLSTEALLTALWQTSGKIIYSVDASLTEELLRQGIATEDADDLPIEFLEKLPYKCFSVEFCQFGVVAHDKKKGTKENLTYSGKCIAAILDKDESGILPFRAIVSLWEAKTGTGTSMWFFPLVGGTYKDCLTALYDALKTMNADCKVTEDDIRVELIPSMLISQFVLYLQSENADTQVRPQKKPSNAKRAPKKKPPRVVDVGYNVGRVIRKHKQAQASADNTSGEKSPSSKKRPHTRRAHWHHYWTGKVSEPESRKLILRWVHPSFVGGSSAKEQKPTIMKVK